MSTLLQITVYAAAGPSCMQCRLTEKRLTALGLTYDLRPADELSDELREQAIAVGAAIQAPLVLVSDATGELAQAWGGYRPDLIDVLAGERMLAA
ncbi:thioredoxin domain-containing protein [Leucobacter aridicollis]